MSLSRALAEKYQKTKISDQKDFFEKFEKFGLKSILPIFVKKFKRIEDSNNFYEICNIVSSKELSKKTIQDIKEKYGIPAEAEVQVKIDESILEGEIVYYQGRKWNDSAKGKLNRFNEM